MGRHIALVLVKLASQALAIDQLAVTLAFQYAEGQFLHIALKRFLHKNPAIQILLELPGHPGPVSTHVLQALEHQFIAVHTRHHSCITLLAALVGAAHSGHQKALVVRFELHLQLALQVKLLPDHLAPPGVEIPLQLPTGRHGLLVTASFMDPHKYGISIPIDDPVPGILDVITRTTQNLVTPASDGTGQARVKKATTGCAQHAIEAIHNNFYGL